MKIQKKGSPPAFLNPRDFMGSYAPDWILARPNRDLRAGAKLVYIALARRYNRQREKAWPSMPTIAAMIGLSARQVRRHVETLSKLGLIQVTATGRSNVYRFPWHGWMVGAKLRPTVVTRKKEDE